jgi:adenylosuccinate lyase
LLDDGRLTKEEDSLKERKLLPDPCYLEELIKYMSTKLIEKLDVELVEMKRSKTNGFMLQEETQMFKMRNQEIKR